MACLAGLAVVGSGALAGEPAKPAPAVTSNERLRRLMAQAGDKAAYDAQTASPERLKERADLLKTGELALSRRQVDKALADFDRAAMILHAADTEMALVRGYMQGGEYRRALAFGAHTAGAHLDVVGGAALYAWLLHSGGQGEVAQRLISQALVRSAGQPLVASVQQQLKSGQPRAAGALLGLPARLAPYGNAKGLPANARVAGSGVLLASGTQALVPLELMPRSGPVWVRNGLGQLARARLSQRLPKLGLALVQLQTVLPVADTVWGAPGDAFPGSVGHAVEYVAVPDATPAWPLLRTGFMGAAQGDSRLLGIDMPPGPRGGPVFDAAGLLSGLARPGKPGQPDQWVTVRQLRKALGKQVAPPPPTGEVTPTSMDKIYESSLRLTLQLMTPR